MDQLIADDGTPLGPIRFKNIVHECYLICKHLNTSYTDVLKMSVTEKNYLLKFLEDDAKAQQEEMKRIKAEREAKKRKY